MLRSMWFGVYKIQRTGGNSGKLEMGVQPENTNTLSDSMPTNSIEGQTWDMDLKCNFDYVEILQKCDSRVVFLIH